MSQQAGPIGLITAIPEERKHFGRHFVETGCEQRAGFRFHKGSLDDRKVILVEAGIGKVNAGIVASLLLDRFAARALIFSGVAGGLDPAASVGDVVIADRLVAHDYGALVDGAIRPYQPGRVPLPGCDDRHGYDLAPALRHRLAGRLGSLDLPTIDVGMGPRRPKARLGTILTGDTFLNCATTRDRLRTRFGGLAVEMEGAAIAQAAERWGVPAIVVRALSDLAGGRSHVDFQAFLPAAAEVASVVVMALLPTLDPD